MNNHEIKNAIIEIKRAIDLDPHGGAKRFVQQLLFDQKIIDFLPRVHDIRDPLPVDWTAAQVTLFDNGPIDAKRSRAQIQRTKMQYGGCIKCWVREGDNKIDFSRESQVAWKANFYLWKADIAERVAEEMFDAKLIDEQSVEDMRSAVSVGKSNAFYSIPLRKMAGGSVWPNSHIVVVNRDDHGFASGGVFCRTHNGGHSIIDIPAFATELHNGNPLGKGAVAQARIARSSDFEGWATDLQLD